VSYIHVSYTCELEKRMFKILGGYLVR
jgi:hypothetical protein